MLRTVVSHRREAGERTMDAPVVDDADRRRGGVMRRLASVPVVAAVALNVSLGQFGDTPDPRSTTADIAAYFTRHRVDVFIGIVLLGAALMTLIVVVSGLAADLHAAARPTAARVAQSSATLGIGVIVVGVIVPYAALSYIVGAEAPDSAKAVFVSTILTTPVAAVPIATCLGAIAVGSRRARLGPSWFVWVTGATAAVMAVTGCSFARAGAFSPDVQQQVLFLLLFVWLACCGFARNGSGHLHHTTV
jgi:hypothetical protein